MGLDIVSISRARRVACRGGEECTDSHLEVSSYQNRKDGLKSGCYVKGKGGRSFGFRACSYFGYYLFRQELSLFFLGVMPQDIWDHPRRFHGNPFVELIDFPDSVGPVVGPKTSAKLASDFDQFASKFRKHILYPPESGETPTDSTFLARMKRNREKCAGFLNETKLARALGGTPLNPEELIDFDWMWSVYRGFRRAFKLARDRGFVRFC